MNIHSLELADNYSLIGIYTAEEDYRLAFLINKHLNTKFYKYKDDLDFKDSIASFSIFKYINKTNKSNYCTFHTSHRNVMHKSNVSSFGKYS